MSSSSLKLSMFVSIMNIMLHKPVSDWLEMLPSRISGLNLKEYFLLDINEMEINELWLNVTGYYIFFTGKIILNLY